MAAELAVRPGFNLDTTFKGHSAAVRSVLRNPNNGHFVSVDDKSIKAWTLDADEGSKVVHNVVFPGYQSTFFTALALAEDINVYFAPCLDGNLRLYSDRLSLKSCMPWHNGLVRCIVYNQRRSEIITAGSYGVRVWECELDHDAYRSDKDVNPYAIARTKDGQVIPWCYGKYQNVKQRLAISIPGVGPVHTTSQRATGQAKASDPATAGSEAGSEAVQSSSAGDAGMSWCDKILVHHASQTLFVMFQGSIYGYEMSQGTMTMRFANLHKSPINCMVYLPNHDLLITSASDSGAIVWRIAGGEPHHFKQIGSASVIIQHMATDPEEEKLLTASNDGVVTLWSIESLLPVYKMKLSRAAIAPCFYSETRFFLYFDSDVKLFTIENLYQGWMECNSDPVSLKQLSYGLILAEFVDSSVRILDSASTAPDKSAATTVPQLSTHNLVTACCSMPAGLLFTLLSNSHIHVWEVHLKKPPTFAQAWTHLAKERCSSMAVLDGEIVPPGVVSALGLASGDDGRPVDHLLLGNAYGDCIVCSIQHNGVSVFRFPAFKHQALQHIALDLDRCMLVTCSRTSIKVWSLNKEVKCVHSLDAGAQVTKLELLEGRAIIGTASGSVLLLDMPTGRTVLSSSTSDHLDSITGIGTSVHLQHFVTSSRDRNIKVFDRDKMLKRSLYLASPISCCCYLNDEGDILLGVVGRLVVVRASSYEMVKVYRVESGDTTRGSIYDGLRGQGLRPKAIIRAEASKLQRLSSAKFPAHVLDSQERAHAASGRSVSPSAFAKIKAKTASGPALRRSNSLSVAIHQSMSGLPPGSLRTTPELQIAGQGQGQSHTTTMVSKSPRRPAGAPLRLPSPPTGSLSVEPPPPKPPSRGKQEAAENLPPKKPSKTTSFRAEIASVQPASEEEAAPPASTSVAASTPSEGKWGNRWVAAMAAAKATAESPEPGTKDHDEKAGDEGGSGDEEEEEEDRKSGQDTSGTEQSAAEASEGSSESDDNSPQAVWRRKEQHLQEQRVLEALKAFQFSDLIHTRYTIDMKAATQRMERRLHGLPSMQQINKEVGSANAGPGQAKKQGLAVASNVTVDASGRHIMQVGNLQVELSIPDMQLASGAMPTISFAASVHSPSVSRDKYSLLPGAGDGLAAAFRRALPIICSGTAFLDENAGLKELKFKRTKLKQGFKKPRKKVAEGAAALEGGAGQGGAGLGGEAPAKKRKKRRKKRRNRLDVIDPVKALERTTTVPAIFKELKDFELHNMFTKQGSKPDASLRTKGSSKQHQQHADAAMEPPDAEHMLAAFRDGWKPSFRRDLEALQDSTMEAGLVQQLLPKIVNVSQAGDAVNVARRLKEKTQLHRAHLLETGQAPHPQAANKQARLIAQVPSCLVREGAAEAKTADGFLTRMSSASESTPRVEEPGAMLPPVKQVPERRGPSLKTALNMKHKVGVPGGPGAMVTEAMVGANVGMAAALALGTGRASGRRAHKT